MENHELASHFAQLRSRRFERTGFPHGAAGMVGHLVRAYDAGSGKALRGGAGLAARKAHRRVARGFAGGGTLVHVGRPGLERKAEPLEEGAPVGRA